MKNKIKKKTIRKMSTHQCGIAAEAYSASILAQCGYNVFVQYGANQPGYDLVATRGKQNLRISVKGSQDAGWLLATKKHGDSYHQSINNWLEKQTENIVFFLIQFQKVKGLDCPRVYVARPKELAEHMKTQRDGKGSASLTEDWKINHRTSSRNDKIPDAWKFTAQRMRNI
jgi:hypothetical protein